MSLCYSSIDAPQSRLNKREAITLKGMGTRKLRMNSTSRMQTLSTAPIKTNQPPIEYEETTDDQF